MASFITPLILLIASVGVFIGFINPQYKEVQSIRAESERYKTALDKYNELTNIRDELNKKRNKMGAAELTKLEKLLPDNVDTVRLVMDINGIADKYGIVIRSIEISKNEQKEQTPGKAIGPDKNKYGTVGLSFNFSAPYPAFLAFLNDLEQSLRIIDVNTISLKTPKENVFDYSINAKTYWLK
jgi:Tfp pilus assembly protein PilO